MVDKHKRFLWHKQAFQARNKIDMTKQDEMKHISIDENSSAANNPLLQPQAAKREVDIALIRRYRPGSNLLLSCRDR